MSWTDAGREVIAQYDEWWNLLGERRDCIYRGQRFIVLKRMAGPAGFYLALEKAPLDYDGNLLWFHVSGFKPAPLN